MNTRREFMGALGGAAVAAAFVARAEAAKEAAGDGLARPVIDHAHATPRNKRPYTGVDWKTATLVNTTSHGHCLNQQMLDQYMKRNFGLITMSNYYPSAPWVPGRTMRANHYRVHHDHPVMVNGTRTAGPFDWNRIMAPWAGELGEKARAQFPFKEGELLFPNWPDGILEAPNAEHHAFIEPKWKSVENLHFCAPGSAFRSGTFDEANEFHTVDRGYNFGSGEPWRVAIDRLIDGFVYPDGGGVTINHPTWTHLDREFILEMLDYDPRVLGIEVLELGNVNNENYWDWVLSTGRQCYGFFVPDWSVNLDSFGVNVLVVPEKTVHACLKAYRDGNFYGAARGFGELRFTNIAFDGGTVTASTDKPARFEVITARGVRTACEGTSVAWALPTASGPYDRREDVGVDIFARVKATAADGCGETLFSQAFILDDQNRVW